eukprot:5557867-Pleurochrysis_carterae.AAC.1
MRSESVVAIILKRRPARSGSCESMWISWECSSIRASTLPSAITETPATDARVVRGRGLRGVGVCCVVVVKGEGGERGEGFGRAPSKLEQVRVSAGVLGKRPRSGQAGSSGYSGPRARGCTRVAEREREVRVRERARERRDRERESESERARARRASEQESEEGERARERGGRASKRARERARARIRARRRRGRAW